NEPYPLYNRVALPPFLRDEARREKVFLRTPEQHEQKGIKLLCQTQITQLDTSARVATAADGQTFPYDRLLIATGGRPNPLPTPGATPDVQGIYNFQYFDDATAIRERMNTAKRSVVVGGSYIAYELAEAFRHHGLEVLWLIRGPRFLRRVLDEDGGALVDDITRTAITVNGGIVTNEYLETNEPDVYAAGDVAEFFDVSIGLHNQMGTWNN